MTTLGQIKLNGRYETIIAGAPTVTQKTPAYLTGHRWLNITDGKSYQLSDADTGTWTQIEIGLDYKLSTALSPTWARVIRECYMGLMRQRSELLEESPDSITRTALYLLQTYVSIYADWTISGSSISVDDVDDIVGTLEDLEYEDAVYIFGSKRNDGAYSIASVDAAGLTFDTTLSGTEADRFMVALIQIPTDLDLIIGRMVWYDVNVRSASMGVQSERIGTYGYTKSEMVGGIAYPSDVVAGLSSYLNSGPIADAEFVP